MNIYVGNLPPSVSEDTLRSLFAAYGQISSVRIIKDKFSGQPRGFGFVEMADNGEAETAIAQLNGAELEGSRLRVNEARPPQARPMGGGSSRGPRSFDRGSSRPMGGGGRGGFGGSRGGDRY